MASSEYDKTVWVVPREGRSRAQYYVRSLGAAANDLRLIEIDGDEPPAKRRAIAAELALAPLRVYSLEDCAGSGLIRDLLIGFPGIVFVHDHLFVEQSAGGDHYPRPELESARKLVFFNERALADVKRDVFRSQGNSTELILTGLPAPAPERVAASRSGILFTGDPRRMEHRAEKLIAALSALAEPPILSWLIEPEEREAASAMAELLPVSYELRTPEIFASLAPFSLCAALLSASPFGDLSPYLEIACSAGLPVIVSDIAVGASLPKDLAFRILPGFTESTEIARVIKALQDGRVGSAVSPKLRQYAAERFSPSIAALDFAAIISLGRSRFELSAAV